MRTNTLGRALDHTRSLDRILSFAFTLDRIRSRDHDRILARAQVLNHVRALNHARTLDRILNFALEHACDLNRDHALARAHTLASTIALARTNTRANTRALDRHLDRRLAHALVAVDGLIELLTHTEPGTLPRAESARSAVAVSPAAQRVTTLVVRLLPTGCRAVKAEELAAELYDIAAAGGPRRRQLAHALRVLTTIVPLRRALSDSGRRAAERG
ncbi:MAG: hypothetical protein HOY79_31340 [Streptomyces sp.]|nr:hypothetical protein [Streptomyces sp.]